MLTTTSFCYFIIDHLLKDFNGIASNCLALESVVLDCQVDGKGGLKQFYFHMTLHVV